MTRRSRSVLRYAVGLTWRGSMSRWCRELRVFRLQLGFTSRQSSKRAQHRGSRRWVEPARNPFVERVKAQADWSPNGDEHRPQAWKRSFKNKARGSQEIGEDSP